MKFPLLVLAVLAPTAFACAPELPPAAVPPLTTALVPPTTAAVASGDTAPVVAAPGAYTGHGADSIPPEVLAKYPPRALPPDVSRHVSAMLDVAGPGVGRVSPDGKSLFFTWRVTGVSQVWKLDGPRHFPSELTGGEDVTNLAGMTPDGRHLFIERDRKGEENPGLYLQDPNGGPLVEIQHKAKVQTHLEAISPDSRYAYFSANDEKPDAYAIYRYDLDAKKRELVFDDAGLWHLTDIRPDGRLLVRKETGSLSAEVWQWDPAKKKLEPIIGQQEKEEYDAQYGAKDGEILLLTNKMGDFRRLYSRVDGKLTPITPTIAFDVSDYTIDDKRTRILYTTNENGFTRPHAIDAKTYKPVALPSFGDVDHVRFGATTHDGRFTTIGVDDGRHPLQAYVLDWTTGKAEKWNAPSAPEVDTTKFVRSQLETYPARDGTKIPVLVRRPEKCASDPCPVVVSFHGGPEGQSLPGFGVFGQMFIDAGFVYVEPNVRGSDGYGKAWSHADDGPKRLDVITDVEDASKWAKVKFASGGKAPKVGVFGGSYGGYTVLMAMTMFAGAYDAGVDIVGISNLKTFLLNTAPYRRILRISEYGDPEKDAAALDKLSPMTYIDRVNAPLLIMQGASDPRVPAGEAIQMHEALENRHVPSELMIFPDEGHGAQKRENRVIMYGSAVAFFQKTLR
jgi:dipeptidyl aminopeptidase/acylaminoacyl peptidase